MLNCFSSYRATTEQLNNQMSSETSHWCTHIWCSHLCHIGHVRWTEPRMHTCRPLWVPCLVLHRTHSMSTRPLRHSLQSLWVPYLVPCLGVYLTCLVSTSIFRLILQALWVPYLVHHIHATIKYNKAPSCWVAHIRWLENTSSATVTLSTHLFRLLIELDFVSNFSWALLGLLSTSVDKCAPSHLTRFAQVKLPVSCPPL